MAQSRLEKIGSVYSRISGLIKAGVIKPDQKPVWLDIYEAFPPKYEPRWDRQPLTPIEQPLRKIFYPEDAVRAQYYEYFGHRKEFHELSDSTTNSMSQTFIQKYETLKARGDIPSEDLFRATVDALELEGINLLVDETLSASPNEPIEEKGEADSVHRGPVKLKAPNFKELFAKGTSESNKPE